MRRSLRHLPLPVRLANWGPALAVALAAAGCQPVQLMQPAAGPVAVVQPGAPQLFAAPPATSAQGVLVDPFAADPAALPPGAVPVIAPGDGGPSRIHVPAPNREWAWEQIVDVVDDYFRVERERQVQLVGDVLTEGRIDSLPQIGATVAEPHRRDSVGRYNQWESTFQTIRRRASIRVIPDGAGLLVDVCVEKDIEDLPRPEYSTAGAATFRNDNSLPSTMYDEAVSRTKLAGAWIFIGRDAALEQRMLADIQARLAPQPASVYASP